ncbi:DUF4157 domain-containing protein [Moorena producens JHB]|uniref:DUF4157 domain-containing protein n=1 Tax=Moorena producens (strain JHB) TaxID=1454205 RepID=A0A1D9G724_MOOP1|nr:DUF4157 domain-containing protein [Moorena producens]AOY83341.2 DUF4157 domain-containing protein [Moorena producens JHB]
MLQIPVRNNSGQPTLLQAKAKEPNRREEETESQSMQGKLPTLAVGEEKVVKPPTMVRHGQVQQHRTKGMPVAPREGGLCVRETPVQRQEEGKKAENKTGLPDRLKEGIERMSGYDLSGVRVNYNSPKPAQLNAHAYTQGQGIEVAPGQERHLPHEAWHVVQQMQGRVRPTMEVNGVRVNGDRGLEQEADVRGKRALQMRSREKVKIKGEEGVRTEGSALKERHPQLAGVREVIQRVKAKLYEGGDDEQEFKSDDEKSALFYIGYFTDNYEELDLQPSDLDKNFIKDVVTRLRHGSYDVSYLDNFEKALTKLQEKSEFDLGDLIESGGKEEEKIDQTERETLIREVREKVEKDIGGWYVQKDRTPEEDKQFMKDVMNKAREIIPRAFNREIEVKKNQKDLLNTVYACREQIINQYAKDCESKGVNVTNKYIHPAAYERLFGLIKGIVQDDKLITGICKDYASLCYGMIYQNDVAGRLNPKLAKMMNHVYVEVTIDGKQYAVDAWFNAKTKEDTRELLTKEEHEAKVTKAYKGISSLTKNDVSSFEEKKKGIENQESIEKSYEKFDVARKTWYENEHKYKKIAEKIMKQGKTEHVNRGVF